MRRTIAVIVVRIIEAVPSAKEQASYGKNNGQHDENQFDIHAENAPQELGICQTVLLIKQSCQSNSLVNQNNAAKHNAAKPIPFMLYGL
jgi:hypothetical protein